VNRAPHVSFPIRTRGRRPSAADIVEGVMSGQLPAGSRLPPVRVLEAQLGMSKNTAQAAYEELASRGIIEARAREGWFVRSSTSATTGTCTRTSTRAELLPPPALPTPRSARISLSTVFVDPELLPREKLADCARSVLKQPGLKPFYDAQGLLTLREAIAARLQRRGMEVTAANVVVTVGSQQALDIVSRTLVTKRIATETPVYPHARMLFESAGLAIGGLPLDPFAGPDLDAWEKAIAELRPGLLYLITSFQNPTGYSYSTHELERILSIATAHDVAILEDDWGSEMLSGSEYRPMLRLLGGENVLYVGSFTKKLWPSMRVGYVIAPESLVPSLVGAKRVSTLGGAQITEAIVAEFLERGYYDGHLEKLQAELDARYAACLDALRELMPDDVRWTTPGGGPTLWLELPSRIDLVALSARLAEKGVAIESADSAFVGERHLNGFRVSYAYSPPPLLREGLEILAKEIR
jgi:DNA-binding transcriptional MocR family regulator